MGLNDSVWVKLSAAFMDRVLVVTVDPLRTEQVL